MNNAGNKLNAITVIEISQLHKKESEYYGVSSLLFFSDLFRFEKKAFQKKKIPAFVLLDNSAGHWPTSANSCYFYLRSSRSFCFEVKWVIIIAPA